MARTLNPRPLWRVSVVCGPAEEDRALEVLGAHFQAPASSYLDVETGRATVSVYLERSPGPNSAVLPALVRDLARAGLPACKTSISRLRAEDWAESWKRHFKPLRIGTRLVVQPSWIQRPRGPAAVIVLDPGLSFGTGQHPTTAYCLRRLVALRRPGQAQSLWDAGTGSGILAIAAARLGFRPVEAVDNDPVAIRIARANARSNDAQVRFKLLDFEQLTPESPRRFDVVCANLLANLLITHRDRLTARLKPGGVLIAAGILAREFSSVEQQFLNAGLRLVGAESKGEWRSGSFLLPP
jgi:ribosomal protein L11 methyltransferase